jgi:hypothetical protein
MKTFTAVTIHLRNSVLLINGHSRLVFRAYAPLPELNPGGAYQLPESSSVTSPAAALSRARIRALYDRAAALNRHRGALARRRDVTCCYASSGPRLGSF